MIQKAASALSDSSIIGWDVAITPNGPILVEGNDTQGNRITQMASRTGKYKVIKQFLKST